MLELTDTTFTRHLADADRPVLVYFWATWCPPCRMLAPVLAELATELADVAEIVKVDLDAEVDTARSQRIMAAPTLNLYRGGELVHSMVGARPKHALLRELEPHLSVLTW
ncbi:thioredoxin family protein [Kibdelosporangium phytohabitans]|uniref:Thioredoxin n=1 Tax=Kibdelosporangium phytohabitans TaxID=860235 RepID=A0A0N9IG09_9PSEU|nr:thioredoxin domain-containing protein [Kibdelosporangium phytohabitans]ALG13830.1 thioredoxin [Kibdelosporangium phytohabitans]MBE1467242.1 thioredoxin 1 [Kibdelosporangium phytohabitans]